ncbi:hypothetical protein IQ254_14410 [Nodosilinea sp. LEGE 07088]|uniref:hypothetical protein n=1 Tax=Nodosilinea sp. LEGE 07088 TaxID=2777968 RepID=UPI00187DEC41|nr:hypothetical protein [Nodosilinea sp. LEGE 07088]MBE9138365.1 hypothetical protein [Nodosilinea sp. LEGE 07088]
MTRTHLSAANRPLNLWPNPLAAIFHWRKKLRAIFSYRIAIGWFGGIQVYRI